MALELNRCGRLFSHHFRDEKSRVNHNLWSSVSSPAKGHTQHQLAHRTTVRTMWDDNLWKDLNKVSCTIIRFLDLKHILMSVIYPNLTNVKLIYSTSFEHLLCALHTILSTRHKLVNKNIYHLCLHSVEDSGGSRRGINEIIQMPTVLSAMEW